MDIDELHQKEEGGVIMALGTKLKELRSKLGMERE